ncbi:HNH endonuclease signature motif containing protein [Anaerolentibacter hominis]|uniref:HNH endonuclease n=1 Tax=Anaerolentibacter hominis TaxID=3079009 RepID=UPI0031B8A7A1
MNYFFVFQNKTFEEEFRGGYLWAPQRGNSGQKVSHWEKMKAVKRGDIIIHSYKKHIKAVSIAKRDVYEASRPEELSAEWQQEGWRVDTTYIPFPETIITSDYREELLQLQPLADAPFNRLGKGKTGYLFEANRPMYEFIIRKTASVQKSDQERQRVLELLDTEKKYNPSEVEIEIQMDLDEAKARQLSPAKLAAQIKNSTRKKFQKKEEIVYYRSPYVKEMVKQIAEGKCQMCGADAPFYDKERKPYLEEHHVMRLADGGSDTMDNVVAICPNCHRKVHVLSDEHDTLILKKIAEQNLKKYHRLLAYSKKLEQYGE